MMMSNHNQQLEHVKEKLHNATISLWERISAWIDSLPETVPERIATLTDWIEQQYEAYNQRRARKRQVAEIKRVIFDSPEFYLLRELYSIVRSKRERQAVPVGIGSRLLPGTYYTYFDYKGKIRENWLELLRQLLRIGDEEEKAWGIVQQIERLEQKRKASTCRPGGYFYTKASKRRKDLPWNLEVGSPKMKKAIRRWPGRSLWRISREAEPLLGELYAIMEERDLNAPLDMLMLGLTQSVKYGAQLPMRNISWILKDPGLKINLDAEDRERLFYSG